MEIKAPPSSQRLTERPHICGIRFSRSKIVTFFWIFNRNAVGEKLCSNSPKWKKEWNLRCSSTLHPLFSLMSLSVIFSPLNITHDARGYPSLMGSCSRELTYLRKMYSKWRENLSVNPHPNPQQKPTVTPLLKKMLKFGLLNVSPDLLESHKRHSRPQMVEAGTQTKWAKNMADLVAHESCARFLLPDPPNEGDFLGENRDFERHGLDELGVQAEDAWVCQTSLLLIMGWAFSQNFQPHKCCDTGRWLVVNVRDLCFDFVEEEEVGICCLFGGYPFPTPRKSYQESDTHSKFSVKSKMERKKKRGG